MKNLLLTVALLFCSVFAFANVFVLDSNCFITSCGTFCCDSDKELSADESVKLWLEYERAC